jgi:antitoxin (DNA-binding transcriptional repressor) of toxin-antitoxin stability system
MIDLILRNARLAGGLIDLQLVAFPQQGILGFDGGRELMRKASNWARMSSAESRTMSSPAKTAWSRSGSRWRSPTSTACASTTTVITDYGVPVARLLGLTATATLERLAADGVIDRPAATRRPIASGRPRPRSRHPVSDIVSDQRR